MRGYFKAWKHYSCFNVWKCIHDWWIFISI